MAEAIGRLGGEGAIAALTSLLGDPDARVAVTAATGLAQRGARQVLLGALGHAEPSVRAAAVGGVLQGRVRDGYPVIASLARRDPSRDVRWAATSALWKLEMREADAYVLEALGASDPGIVLAAHHLLVERVGSDLRLDVDAWKAALARWCEEQAVQLVSDEIYHGIEYAPLDGDEALARSAWETSREAIVFSSFSKYFSMTGWRIGWMVVPEDHVRRIERLAQNMFICPPHASQIAALAALDCSAELEANRAVYAENRRLMLAALPAMGFDRIAPPDGAFYIYADVGHLTDDSRAFAAEILAGAGVAVTPGLDFDPARGGRTLRFSYARATADIREGLARLHAFMSARR